MGLAGIIALAATIVASGHSFACTPTMVWDGDGPVHCAEGPIIRLAGIAAREMDGSCRAGHPCPRASAAAARDNLVRLLGGARGIARTGHIRVSGSVLRCRSNGHAGGRRTAAFCTLTGVGDLSCAQVRAGVAAIWPRHWGSHRCR